MNDDLSLDDAIALLEEPQTVEDARAKRRARGDRDEYVAIMEPLCKGVKFVETKGICSPGRCGSVAYIHVNGEPRCLMHAFRDVCKMLHERES